MKKEFLCSLARMAALLALCFSATRAIAQLPELKDGDRVVFLGNTFLEREQRYGYIETALTSAWPDHKIIFRNLGWSGDSVFGEARAYFGGPEDGYKHLITHVRDLKPTVIFVSYGANAAFDGPAGLERFEKGLERLLGDLKATGARLVLLGILPHQAEHPGLPDPATFNTSADQYNKLLERTAHQHQQAFVSLADLPAVGQPLSPAHSGEAAVTHRFPLTVNNVHLSAAGYWRTAAAAFDPLKATGDWSVTLSAKSGEPQARGTMVSDLRRQPAGVSFRSTDPALPLPPVRLDHRPGDSQAPAAWGRTRLLRVLDLSPGRYELRIDGQPAGQWNAGDLQRGVLLPDSPEWRQAEELRQAIVKKNDLFFHQYRPQNETYLRGFRKHEQGQNAKEIAEFQPFIEEMERRIDTLKKPAPRTYELVKTGEETR